MEKSTGFEPVEKEHQGSSMEQEAEPVKTVTEKEIAVQNVEYADAVKDLSPWVSFGRVCILRIGTDSGPVGRIPQIVHVLGVDSVGEYDERVRWFAYGQHQRTAVIYQVLRSW